MNQPVPTIHALQYYPKGKEMGRDGVVVAMFVGYCNAVERFAQNLSRVNKSMVQIVEPDEPLKTYRCWNKGERVW